MNIDFYMAINLVVYQLYSGYITMTCPGYIAKFPG